MTATPNTTRSTLAGGKTRKNATKKYTKRQVFNGTGLKTSGGLTKDKLKKVRRGTRIKVDKDGKKTKVAVNAIVSKARHKNGLKNKWSQAIKKARTKLKIKGFVKIKKIGSAEETQLYRTAKEIYLKTKKPAKKTSTKKKK